MSTKRGELHSVGNWVDGQAYTNGLESFWAMLKRGYHGVYHRMSPEHLSRYVDEFVGRHNHATPTPSSRCGPWPGGSMGSG